MLSGQKGKEAMEGKEAMDDPTGSSISAITLKHCHKSADFIIMGSIGKGGYGEVFKCKSVLDGNIYALKQIGFKRKNYEKKIREVETLAKMNHPNVLRYYQAWVEERPIRQLAPQAPTCNDSNEGLSSDGSDEDRSCLYILTEFCPQTLKDLLEKKGGIPIDDVPRMFEELAEGVKYIHGKGIIHRDISRDNVFVDEYGCMKIGDFGLAIRCGEEGEIVTSQVGNQVYLVPKIKKGSVITSKVDIYALGMLLVEMTYHMDTDYERYRVFDELKKKGNLPKVNAAFYDLCDQMLGDDPPCAARCLVMLKKVRSSLSCADQENG